MDLVLRQLRMDDEQQFLASPYRDHPFGYYEEGMPFAAYLARLDEARHGIDLPSDHVPNVRLYGFVGATMVGSLAIRLGLKGMLVTLGGHIGYQVFEPYQRRGYGTEMLRQAIPVCRQLGLDRILVTCDADNIASKRVIETNGGVYDSTVDKPIMRAPRLRYWIETGDRE